ncbi:S-layer homology domain-containing protein [Desulfovibrio ferrophilus]|uniref:S-layer domain-containing protein n=1 Tax=Desulfovibrio ferrophilus TaxID=241368 RepID=A0A2Z6AW46_9BACT|nr:S-layer homology domain-containing protein [Desulfovibrio ferrophilus]BBD07464.1 S-layer domain-containing protein [Desulfovibrio ferrophilus]
MWFQAAKRLTILAGVMLLALALGGCGSKQPRVPVGVMDSPAHHFNNGLKFLDEGNALMADREFDLALSIEAEYPPALAGKGVVMAMNGNEDALDLVDDARDAADDWGPEVRMWPEVMELRVLTEMYSARMLSREDFLEEIVDIQEEALEMAPHAPQPYFYMGEAYVRALEFGPAEGQFHKVLLLAKGYEARAEKRWRLVQDVNRAAPNTVVGKKIALVEALTRADLAALMVEELDVDKFYTRTDIPLAGEFVEPVADQMILDTTLAVTDITEHPLRADIEKVLHYEVKGLGLYPDRSFHPDEPVTRAEAAMIFEDVVVRSTGRLELATQFIGQESRIPDMRGDHPAYNAAMLNVTRGIMDADIRTGLFRPLDTVSGIEALLAVKALRRELSLF